MRTFDQNDGRFQVEVLGSGNYLPEHLEHMSFKEFWGDDYEWVALVPLAWKLANSGLMRIKPPSVEDHRALAGWWSVPLHICVLGLGWNNVARGLRNWREGGYVANTAALQFLKNTYGPGISALEVFLIETGFNDDIIETMGAVTTRSYTTSETPEPLLNDLGEYESAEEFLERANRQQQLDKAWMTAFPLLSGGTDPLHISFHFTGSADYSETIVHDVEELDEIKVISHSLGRIAVEAPAYKGFAYRLIQAGSAYWELEYQDEPIISLHIRNIGFIGDFTRCRTTGRFYLVDALGDRAEGERIHMMGN